MNRIIASYKPLFLNIASTRYAYLLRAFFAGLLLPFGFAPFHLPGLAILGIALLFAQLRHQPAKQAFFTGFVFGLGFLGLGVSWIFNSIHEYGHLNSPLSALITFLFVFYLSIYLGLVAIVYNRLAIKSSLLFSCFLFSAIWSLGEYLRSTLLTGFPWLLIGFGQMDTPLKYLLPIIGVYGLSFLTCLSATFLATSTQTSRAKRYLWIIAFVTVLLLPSMLKNKEWTTVSKTPVSVAVLQANLSMRDKWDESLFWQLLQYYQDGIEAFIGKKDLIVLPESAIPLPASYISEVLDRINLEAKQTGSSILLGIPKPTNSDQTHFYNGLMGLGTAEGSYSKQHLVPFGEFVPQPFERIMTWLSVPLENLKPGKLNQALMMVGNHPIATLICYELAYPQLLRKQLPAAEWIVSISDDGWFGHSFAMYQHLQMAQALSMQTGRFQVVANNDGLSSMIDAKGSITASLPAFTAGQLEASLFPATDASPWAFLGDFPILIVCILIVLLALIRVRR